MLLVDARELGSRQSGLVTLEEPARRRILDAWQTFQQGGYPEEAGFCVCVSRNRIAEMNWDLNPRQYVYYPPEPLSDWPELAGREKVLNDQLVELLQDNARLLRELLQREEA